MKAAIMGCKNISYSDLQKHLPKDITEIVWSGESELLYDYARCNNIKLTLAKKDSSYGNAAAFIRNIDVVRDVDIVIVFWDGKDAAVKTLADFYGTINKTLIFKSF